MDDLDYNAEAGDNSFYEREILVKAIQCGNLTVLDREFIKNPRVFASDKSLKVPCFLHIAARANQLLVVERLIEKYYQREQIDYTDELDDTPLNYAIRAKSLAIVAVLVKHGAKVDHLNKHYDTPLHIAAYETHDPIFRFLFDHGGWVYFSDARTKEKRVTPYQAYLTRFNKALADKFLEKSKQFRALFNGVYMETTEVLDSAAQYSPAILQHKNKQGQTIFHLATQYHSFVIVVALCEQYEQLWQLNALDFRQQTPLWSAIQSGNIKIIKFLIQKGVCNAINAFAQTPLHIASIHGYFEIAKALIDDPNCVLQAFTQDNKSEIPLFDAIRARNLFIIQLLLGLNEKCQISISEPNRKVDMLEVTNTNFDTVMHVAAEQGDITILKLLIDKGSVLTQMNLNQKNPMHLLFEKHGDDIALHCWNYYQAVQNLKKSDGLTYPTIFAHYV